MTMLAPRTFAYHAGRCGLCDRMVQEGRTAQVVRLHVFAPAGSVTLHCWLCPVCQPTPDTISATTANLLERVLDWYRSTPSVWPTLQQAERG